MTKSIHPLAGGLATLTIAIFWLSTVASELSGSHAAIVAAKSAIPWGLLVLVPALAATGGTGLQLAGGRRPGPVTTKIRRTAISGANGLLVLVPSALFLAHKARAGEFDQAFHVVQAIELIAGAVNLTLFGLNMRDGFRLTGRFRNRPGPGRASGRPAH